MIKQVFVPPPVDTGKPLRGTKIPPRIEAHLMCLGNAAHWALVCWRIQHAAYIFLYREDQSAE